MLGSPLFQSNSTKRRSNRLMDHIQDVVEHRDSSFRRSLSSRRSAQMMSFIKLNMIHENTVLKEEEWKWLIEQEKQNLAEVKTEGTVEVGVQTDEEENKVDDSKEHPTKQTVKEKEEQLLVSKVNDEKEKTVPDVSLVQEIPNASIPTKLLPSNHQQPKSNHKPTELGNQTHTTINKSDGVINLNSQETRRPSVVKKGILKNNGMASKYSLNGNDVESSTTDAQVKQKEEEKKKKGVRGFFKNVFAKNSKPKKKKREVLYL